MGSFESFRRVDVYGFAMLMWETLRRCMTHDGVEVCCARLRTIMITPMMMTTKMMTTNDNDNNDDDNCDGNMLMM